MSLSISVTLSLLSFQGTTVSLSLEFCLFSSVMLSLDFGHKEQGHQVQLCGHHTRASCIFVLWCGLGSRHGRSREVQGSRSGSGSSLCPHPRTTAGTKLCPPSVRATSYSMSSGHLDPLFHAHTLVYLKYPSLECAQLYNSRLNFTACSQCDLLGKGYLM